MRTMTAFNRKLLSAVLMTTTALALSGCKLRFAPPQEAAAPQPVKNTIGLKTAVRETTDPLKPYAVDITVSAKSYSGLVLVKATEQIPIDQKVSLKGLSETPGKSSSTYSQLSKITDAEFQYADKNVNPHDVFWYAVIRPDASGETGTIEESGQLPQPSRVQIPASKGTPTVILAASVENSGSGLKPYVVKLSVSAPMGDGTDLKLVRAEDSSEFVSGNYTVLAQITSSPFTYNDNVLYPTDSAVYGIVNGNVAHQYVIPSPASITLPSLNNSFAELQLTQIQTLGQLPDAKLTFNPVFGKTVLKKFVNGLEVDSIDLAQGQSEYIDEDLAFDKNFSYQLSQFDHYNTASGVSSVLAVKYDWPIMNFGTEFSAAVNAKAAMHQYQIRLDDLSTVKRILQVQVSGDGTNFTTAQTWTDETSTRYHTIDFSAPTTRYARVIQIDRNNNTLATSSVYTLVIPEDREYTGVNNISSNITGLGRLKLSSGASLIYGTTPITISADSLISDNGIIRAFAVGSQATLNQNGLNAGDISLSFKNATGALTVNSSGQRGGNGSPGSKGAIGSTGTPATNRPLNTFYCMANGNFVVDYNATPLTGVKGGTGGQGGIGGPGNPGRQGGNSGKIQLEATSDITGFVPTLTKDAINGGTGGSGGAGGDGGLGGAGGRGSLLIVYASENPLTYGFNCVNRTYGDLIWQDMNTWTNPWPGQQWAPSGAIGNTGPVGQTGSAGSNGLPGTANVACYKYPGQAVQTCN